MPDGSVGSCECYGCGVRRMFLGYIWICLPGEKFQKYSRDYADFELYLSRMNRASTICVKNG